MGAIVSNDFTLLQDLTARLEDELIYLRDRTNDIETLESKIHVENQPGADSGSPVPQKIHQTLTDKLLNYIGELQAVNNRLGNVVSHLNTIV